MTATINVNARNLDAAFVENLKSRFSDANLEIRVQAPGEASADAVFSDADFWSVIGKLDWKHEGNDEKVLAPAVAAMAEMPLAHIYRFADILSEKLWQLDTEAHAQVFLDDPEMGDYLSVDDFLYARCAVVANGPDAFEKVLKKPKLMPTEFTFEPLLRLASDAYRRKTGHETLIVPAYNYETYSNRQGWKS